MELAGNCANPRQALFPGIVRVAALLLALAFMALPVSAKGTAPPNPAEIPPVTTPRLPVTEPAGQPAETLPTTDAAQARLVQLRRERRRILRLLGLARGRELAALQAEQARLRDELERAQKALAARGNLDRARLDGQMSRLKSEIDFRTRLWRKAAAGDEALPGQFGFVTLDLTAPDPLPPEPYFTKQYRDRLEVSGLEARRACWLELACLRRLQGLDPAASAHFPMPVALDADAPRLTMTDQGWSLDRVPAHLRGPVAARLRATIDDQSARIVAALERAGIAHLDTHASGRNVTIDEKGHVSLIDFDIAVIDGRPISGVIARRFSEWGRLGGADNSRARIAGLLTRFCDDAETGRAGYG